MEWNFGSNPCVPGTAAIITQHITVIVVSAAAVPYIVFDSLNLREPRRWVSFKTHRFRPSRGLSSCVHHAIFPTRDLPSCSCFESLPRKSLDYKVFAFSSVYLSSMGIMTRGVCVVYIAAPLNAATMTMVRGRRQALPATSV